MPPLRRLAERPAAVVPAPVERPHPTPRPRPAPSAHPAPVAVPDAEEAPPTGPADDVWTLVARAQQGDGEAFGRIYDLYAPPVHRYLLHRLGDRTLAEDLTSETFVRALRRIDSLTFQGRDVGAWLVTIARNLVLYHVKSSR